jgi:hypothetical protein
MNLQNNFRNTVVRRTNFAIFVRNYMLIIRYLGYDRKQDEFVISARYIERNHVPIKQKV